MMGGAERERRRSLRWTAGQVAGALVLYVGSFLLLVLDEAVLGTLWVVDLIPEGMHGAIVDFYSPLIWVYEALFE